MKKRFLVCLSAILAISSLAGCTSTKTGGETTDEYVYAPQATGVEIDGTLFQKAVEKDDKVYVISDTWFDEEENMDQESADQDEYVQKVQVVDLKDNSKKDYPIILDGNGYAREMCFNTNGNLLIVINTTEVTGSGENQTYHTKLGLAEMSVTDGSILNFTDITDSFEQVDQLYISRFGTDKDGNLYFADESGLVIILDKNYKPMGKIPVNSWIMNMFTDKAGDTYICAWGNEGVELKKLDAKAGTMGANVNIVKGYGNNTLYEGKSKNFMVSTPTKCFAFSTGDEEETELFQWFDVNVDSSKISGMGETEDGRIWIITSSQTPSANADPVELTILSKVKASELPQKEKIVLGTLSLDDYTRTNIFEFNKDNEKYHISVKEYAGEDYMAGLQQLNNDLIGDACPDILDLSSINYSDYMEKGLFEDLYPYMEKSGVNKEDYLENVMSYYEEDNKLYAVMPCFQISTMVMPTSKANGAKGWNLAEFQEFIDNQKAEDVFQYGSAQQVLYSCYYYNMGKYVDWKEGKCYFDSDEFAGILKTASKFPVEVNYESGPSVVDRISEKRMNLLETRLGSVHAYQSMRAMFNEDITFIGFPNENKTGNIITPYGGSLAITTKSEHKDGAWEFILKSISDDAQSKLSASSSRYGIPFKKSAFDRFLSVRLEPVPQVEKYTSTLYEGFHFLTVEAKQEDVDAIREIVNSAVAMNDSVSVQISKIIDEEAQACFSGQKSAEETVKVIQNRAQTYVNENR